MVKQSTEIETVSTKQSRKRGRPPSGTVTFPRNPLKETLKIAETIERENAGQPFDPILIAKSLGTTARSGDFSVLCRSSERYGLTQGQNKSKAISLTTLGSAIVAPTDESVMRSNLRIALLKPSLFQNFYTKYDRKNIPKEEFLKNALEKEFTVPRADIESCYKIIMQNISDYGLSMQSGQSTILYLDNIGKAIQTAESKTEVAEAEGLETSPTEISETEKPIVTKPKQIFVAHGKNKKPLDQLERILNKFKTVTYKVATEEPNRGLPVSGKVADLMKECTSGIFIFTADEETKDTKGNTVWRPSDNVVYELGAASVLYGRKIVIFKEEDVMFASDFSDIGYIPFEKDKLDAKTADLMLELINLGFMQLTPT